MSKKEDRVELDLDRKKPLDWSQYSYADDADQYEQDLPVSPSATVTNCVDTIVSSNPTNRETVSVKKNADKVAQEESSGLLARFWNWISSPFVSKAEEKDIQAIEEKTATGATSVGVPAIEKPAKMSEEELDKLKKQLMKEMLAIFSEIRKGDDSENNSENNQISNDTISQRIIRSIIAQRKIQEDSTRSLLPELSIKREQNNEIQQQILDTNKRISEVQGQQKTWNSVNFWAGVANTAVIIGPLALNVISSIAATAFTGGSALPLIISGLTAQAGWTITALKVGTTVARAGTMAYTAHLDHKQGTFQGEIGSLRSQYDITLLKCRDIIGQTIQGYISSLDCSKQIRRLLAGLEELARAIIAR